MAADIYDINGNPISLSDWTSDRGAESDWAKVKRETKTVGATVSTVWLGMDHRFGDDGPPLIFETLVFGGGLDQQITRYSTLEEAHAGHERVVEQVRIEADAFAAVASDLDVIAAVKLIELALAAHRSAFSIEDYERNTYSRLVEAISEATS